MVLGSVRVTAVDRRAGRVQTLVLEGWHPTTTPNAQKRHWRDVQRRHHVDRDMAWASALQAGWTPVVGKARLTVTLVYSRRYRVDADNLAARCKGLIDGLKPHVSTARIPDGRVMFEVDTRQRGFIVDDDTEHLELRVLAEVRPGAPKCTELMLEAIDQPSEVQPSSADHRLLVDKGMN